MKSPLVTRMKFLIKHQSEASRVKLRIFFFYEKTVQLLLRVQRDFQKCFERNFETRYFSNNSLNVGERHNMFHMDVCLPQLQFSLKALMLLCKAMM